MVDFDSTTVDSVVQHLNQDNDTNREKDQYAVVVTPPAESENARDMAEQLFTDLHGLGRLSFEIPTDEDSTSIQIVVEDRPTAELVARQTRADLGAAVEISKATLPIDESDPIAAATFRFERDLVYPLATNRTDEGETGPLHHLLDSMAAEEHRGCYQVVAEPIEEDDWMTRRSRALPESIQQERDAEDEMKRAGMAMVPALAVSLMVSPFPLGTSLVVALALLVAASVGEGVRLPQRRTGEEIAAEIREQAKEAHGASSTQAKKAEATAETIIEQAHAPGWQLSVRLVVAGDTATAATRHRDRLATQIERAFASDTTKQRLTATIQDASETFARVRNREIDPISSMQHAHRVLAHGTRRSTRAGSAEFASLAYFADRDGGGSDAREFVTNTEMETMPVPEIAPEYVRPQAIADGGAMAQSEFRIDPDRTETRQHREFGQIETQVIEETASDEQDNHWAGEFCRELVESSQRDSQTWLGYVEDGEQIRELGLTPDQLRQHFFLVGASGTGKSTLAEILSQQYSWEGRGFAVIDPHDDLVDDILEKIPAHRKDDVVVVDPANITSEFTHTFDFLSVEVDEGHDDYRKAVNGAVSDTVGVICQGASSVGDRMKDVLYGLVRGMILSDEDYTLLDMRDILRHDSDRDDFAAQMRSEGYEYIAEFAEDLADLSSGDLAPVKRLLNKWVLSKTSRELISHAESSISFRKIIEDDKILLLRNDLADDDMQRLVATVVFKGLVRAARQRPKGGRPTFPLLIDETDDIHTPEMDLGSVIGNARKFGLSLTLMTQLPKNLEDVQEELETNCKNWIVYCCPSDTQSNSIASMFGCDQDSIQSVGDYRSFIRLEIEGDRDGPFLTEMMAPMPPIRSDEEAEEEIVIPSRQEHGVRRDRVDDDGELVAEDDASDNAPDQIDEFVRMVANAAANGDLVEGEHYIFVHKGKSTESLRINPSQVIETLEDPAVDDPETITSLSKERVDDEADYVTGHRQNSPPIGRCLGASMSDLTATLSAIDRGMFLDQ